MTFEIYFTRPILALGRKRWNWRLKARNGEIIASGESYVNLSDCRHAVTLVRSSADARLVVLQ